VSNTKGILHTNFGTTALLRGLWLFVVVAGVGLLLASINRSHQLHYKGRPDPWAMAFGALFTVSGLLTVAVLLKHPASQGVRAASKHPALSRNRPLFARLLSYLVILGALFLFAGAGTDNLVLYSSQADYVAQSSLNTIVFSSSRLPWNARSFRGESIAAIQALVPDVPIVVGPVTRPDEVSLTLCTDGPGCRLLSAASRSSNGTCWYIIVNIGRHAVDGFQPGEFSFGGNPTVNSCSAGTPGHPPVPADGWQQNAFPQSWK
jgi:hypothetical protein